MTLLIVLNIKQSLKKFTDNLNPSTYINRKVNKKLNENCLFAPITAIKL